MPKFMEFLRSDDGAITVDWVVLTATIATLGLVVAVTVGSQTKVNADGTGARIDSITVTN